MIRKWCRKFIQKPIAATMEEWAEWNDTTKKNHPILYFLLDRLPLKWSIMNSRIRDFKYHLFQKYGRGYHLLRLDVKRFKSPYGKERLHKYGWIDAEHQLALFSFQILVNFVEKEVGLKEFIEIAYDTAANPTSDKYKELLELYYWFIDEYCDNTFSQKLKAELREKYPNYNLLVKRDLFSKPKTQEEREFNQDQSVMFAKITDHQENLDKEMTENLIKLIKLRGCMWT